MYQRFVPVRASDDVESQAKGLSVRVSWLIVISFGFFYRLAVESAHPIEVMGMMYGVLFLYHVVGDALIVDVRVQAVTVKDDFNAVFG